MVNYNITPVDFSPLAGIGQAYAQSQQRQAQEERRKQLISQAQNVFRGGDFNQMAEFAIANPELGKTMFELGGVRDEAAQQRMVGLSKSIATSINPVEGLQAYIQDGTASGRDMSHSIKMLENSGGDPEKLKKIAEMGWVSNDPQGFKVYQSTKPKTPEQMTEYQSAMIEQKKIDQDLRREEAEIKRNENRLKNETNELKIEELKNKIDASKQKVEEGKRIKEESAITAVNASQSLLESIDQLASNEGYINSLTGYRGRLPVSATDEGVEAEALFDNITNSLTLDNLKLMSGVLTDKDIELLRSAASGLQKGMGTDRFKEILQRIRGKVETGLEQKKRSMPQKTTAEMSDEELLMKYGG